MDISLQHNKLFKLARLGKRGLSARFDKIYPALALFYALVAPLVTSAIVSIPLAVYFILAGKGQLDTTSILSSSPGFTILLLLGFGLIFLLIWAWLWLFERRPFWTIRSEERRVGKECR